MMRTFLSHAFVLLVNYYFLAFAVGLGLAAATLGRGPWPVLLPAGLVVAAFGVALGYQLTRGRWAWQSIGEQLLGCTSKTDIRAQTHDFTVRRGGLLGLMLLTLALNGNLLDGLTGGMSYGVADVLLLLAVGVVQYQAFRHFVLNPGMVPVVALAGLLAVLSVLLRSGYGRLVSDDLLTLYGTHAAGLYKGLAGLWLLVGYYYRKHARIPTE